MENELAIDKYFPKGNKLRGQALVVYAEGFIDGQRVERESNAHEAYKKEYNKLVTAAQKNINKMGKRKLFSKKSLINWRKE